MFYGDIFRGLADANIRYAVTGGVALVLHGVVRLTVDLDLIIDLSEPNVRHFIELMKRLEYSVKQPVSADDLGDPDKRRQWAEEKNMFVCSFYHSRRPMELVDIFITEPIPFEQIEKEIVLFEGEGIRIPVVSKKHLKQLKMLSHREQDLADIEILDRLSSEGERQ